MKNSVSTSTDHSILCLSFHSTELPRCLVTHKLSSRDGETTKDNNNSGLMKFQRPSETTTGKTTALIFKAMVTATTLELSLASIQDGGRCSDTKMDSSPTKEERLSKLLEELMMRIETLE
jgi:hypothetical protein